MAQLNDFSLMPFGKYKGTEMINVPASYLLWCDAQDWCKGDLKNYITENKQVLEQQAKSNK